MNMLFHLKAIEAPHHVNIQMVVLLISDRQHRKQLNHLPGDLLTSQMSLINESYFHPYAYSTIAAIVPGKSLKEYYKQEVWYTCIVYMIMLAINI